MGDQNAIWARDQNRHVGRFPKYLGLESEELSPGHVVVHLRDAPENLRNSREAINGGVIATMFDWALGMAVASGVNSDESGRRISQATVSLDISYQRAAMGTSFRAIGTLRHHGSTLAFAEGSIVDEADNVCATAHGIWRLLS